MLHGAWHTVRVGGNKAALLKSSWIDSGSRELGLSNVSQALGSGSACMASARAELVQHSVEEVIYKTDKKLVGLAEKETYKNCMKPV